MRRKQVHVARADARRTAERLDTAAGDGSPQRYIGLSVRVIDYIERGRRDRRLRTATGVDVAFGRPDQDVASVRCEHARLIDLEITVGESIHITGGLRNDSQLIGRLVDAKARRRQRQSDVDLTARREQGDVASL